MTISVKQLAHAVNSCTRIIPLYCVHVNVHGEESWLVYHAVKDCVKYLYPCAWYTSQTAIDAYCETMDIDRQNVIVQYEEA